MTQVPKNFPIRAIPSKLLVKNPLKLVTNTLESELMIVRGIEELILEIEDSLQSLEDGDNLRLKLNVG